MELARCWGLAQNGDVVEVAVHPSLVDELDRRWPCLGLEHRLTPISPVTARFGLSDEWMIVPDRERSGDSPAPAAWDLLESELGLFAVTRLARLVAVHSTAIAWNGSVMVVPASSGGGKSTLAIAASEVGARVLSDEFTLIDPESGLVTGWTRPVRRIRDDGTVERLDLALPTDPMPVGLVAAVTYEPASAVGWAAISPAETTVELLSHTLCTRTRPDDALDAVLKLTRASAAVAGPRGEASTEILDLLAMLDESVPPSTGLSRG